MLKLAAMLALGSILIGCATIITEISGGQTVAVNSEPTGAKVEIDGVQYGRTPQIIKIRPKQGAIMKISKDGFVEQVQTLDTKLHVAFLGNFITGGLIGSTIDYASGAMWEYDPGNYHVALRPLESAPADKWERDLPLTAFLFENKDRLLSDLSKRSGETVDSLLVLLGTPDSESMQVRNELAQLSQEHKRYPDFVKSVLARARLAESTPKRPAEVAEAKPDVRPAPPVKISGRKVALFPASIRESNYPGIRASQEMGDTAAKIADALKEEGFSLAYSSYQQPQVSVAYHTLIEQSGVETLANNTWTSTSIFSDPSLNEGWVKEHGVSVGAEIVVTLRVVESRGEAKYTLYWIDLKTGKTSQIDGSAFGGTGSFGSSVSRSLRTMINEQGLK